MGELLIVYSLWPIFGVYLFNSQGLACVYFLSCIAFVDFLRGVSSFQTSQEDTKHFVSPTGVIICFGMFHPGTLVYVGPWAEG